MARTYFLVQAVRGFDKKYNVKCKWQSYRIHNSMLNGEADNLTPTIYWTQLEGAIAACLPTLRPLFSGWSSESIIDRWRSKLPLHFEYSKSSLYANSKDQSTNDGRRNRQVSLIRLTADPYGAVMESYIEATPLEEHEAQASRAERGDQSASKFLSCSRSYKPIRGQQRTYCSYELREQDNPFVNEAASLSG